MLVIAACCCCFYAATRCKPCIFLAAPFRRMTDMVRCMWLFQLPCRNGKLGKAASTRPASRSKAAPIGRAAATAFISAIRTAICSNWPHRACGQDTETALLHFRSFPRNRETSGADEGSLVGLAVDRNNRPAGDEIFRGSEKRDRRRHLFDPRPKPIIGFWHGLPIGWRVHDRRRYRIDQDAVLGDFLG